MTSQADIHATILLVDDNKEALESTAATLRQYGFRVVTQSTGFGVTNTVRRVRPNAIVLDVMMPGLTGDGLGRILSTEIVTPIVYFSAMPEEELRDIAARTPGASYVLKSEGVTYLGEELRRRLLRAHLSGPGRNW